MEVEWDSINNWETSGVLLCNLPNTYWLTKLCALTKTDSGGIAFHPLAFISNVVAVGSPLMEELEKLKWVPEDLGKARALIETVVRMEGYDGN